jgi:hypothetical protein
MRMIALATLCAACAPAAAPVPHGMHLDSRMYGTWTLDAARSHFGGPYPAPTSGMVNWNEHGWAFAIGSNEEVVYTDAVSVDQGCALVGVSGSVTCAAEATSPTHVHMVIREGGRISRVADIDLLDDNTQRAVHVITPSEGAPYTETTLWTRSRP